MMLLMHRCVFLSFCSFLAAATAARFRHESNALRRTTESCCMNCFLSASCAFCLLAAARSSCSALCFLYSSICRSSMARSPDIRIPDHAWKHMVLSISAPPAMLRMVAFMAFSLVLFICLSSCTSVIQQVQTFFLIAPSCSRNCRSSIACAFARLFAARSAVSFWCSATSRLYSSSSFTSASRDESFFEPDHALKHVAFRISSLPEMLRRHLAMPLSLRSLPVLVPRTTLNHSSRTCFWSAASVRRNCFSRALMVFSRLLRMLSVSFSVAAFISDMVLSRSPAADVCSASLLACASCCLTRSSCSFACSACSSSYRLSRASYLSCSASSEALVCTCSPCKASYWPRSSFLSRVTYSITLSYIITRSVSFSVSSLSFAMRSLLMSFFEDSRASRMFAWERSASPNLSFVSW
mmetsp:Transcript_42552/g.120372  ORF Transcript_42552/g.120372 Transcript_42552/m.120372 type:complete len:410 (-) Transcript_42552:387-1616(-)